jgi:CheY-like chemotaxis protein
LQLPDDSPANSRENSSLKVKPGEEVASPLSSQAPSTSAGPLHPQPAMAPSSEVTRRRLLLVEDDPASRKALKAIMGRRGWDVSVATNLAEAHLHLDDPIDVLILDLMLPDGDGTTLLNRIRTDQRTVKVVVTTGSNDSEKLATVRLLQPDSVLLKPVDLDKLIDAVGEPE